MKYPFVVFYRLDKFSDIDNYLITNNSRLECSLYFTSNKDDLNKLFIYKYQPSFLHYTLRCLVTKYLNSCLEKIVIMGK